MLRITVQTQPKGATVVLEGRLGGPWVYELGRCWRELKNRNLAAIRVDLDGVSFVDASGEALLRAMHDEDVVLTGRELVAQGIVDGITR